MAPPTIISTGPSARPRWPPWTSARLHPQPATAVITDTGELGVPLTRRGAAVCYPCGPGLLVIDNLRWELDEFDEPERPRRFLTAVLTNLGVPLTTGAQKQASAKSMKPRKKAGNVGIFEK